MSLAGKFFMHMGKEYGQTGQIIEHVTPTIVLVQMHKCDHFPASKMLLDVTLMLTKVDAKGAFQGEWEIFDTREELDAFDTWLSTDHDDDAMSAAVLN